VIQRVMADIPGAPSAVWLPVFPSAAGFGAIVKNAAGGLILERWFSQLPSAVDGVAGHKQVANRFLPLLATLTRSGLPSPEHVPTSAPEPVVRWLRDALDRHGKAGLSGYATSVTAVARWAVDHGIDLTGAIAIPSSEPVTASKLAAIRASGMTPRPQYAFVPEGVMAMACGACDDEDYHLWRNEMTVITRRRDRGDGTPVDAFLWTSLDDLSPRVFVNVENDDYGAVVHDVGCDCVLGRLGLTTHVRDIRGMSKVVAAGITLSGDELHHIVEVELPQRLGGGPGDYQFVEEDGPAGTRVSLRVHPRVGSIDHDAAVAAVRAVLARSDNGVLAQRVWMPEGRLHTVREAPAITRGGKTLPYERLGGGPTPAAAPDIS